MGYSISWLATKSIEPSLVQSILGLSKTEQNGSYADHRVVGRLMPSGWYLIITNECDDVILNQAVLQEISEHGDVMACSIEEHVMFSSSEYWSAGKINWKLEHDAQEGMYNLVEKGKLPTVFKAIKQKETQQQDDEGGVDADVDFIFEIPLQLAKYYVGFKHDEFISEDEEDIFVVLEPRSNSVIPERKKPFWKFW